MHSIFGINKAGNICLRAELYDFCRFAYIPAPIFSICDGIFIVLVYVIVEI